MQLRFSVEITRIVRDRFNLCDAVKRYTAFRHTSGDHTPRLLSFDDGGQSRPYMVYFQNFICNALGVKVEYPFANKNTQILLQLYPDRGQR